MPRPKKNSVVVIRVPIPDHLKPDVKEPFFNNLLGKATKAATREFEKDRTDIEKARFMIQEGQRIEARIKAELKMRREEQKANRQGSGGKEASAATPTQEPKVQGGTTVTTDKDDPAPAPKSTMPTESKKAQGGLQASR
ncbi:MAG: hypothetical protein WCH98_02770 [Verrucomicrobiota bacterium]